MHSRRESLGNQVLRRVPFETRRGWYPPVSAKSGAPLKGGLAFFNGPGCPKEGFAERKRFRLVRKVLTMAYPESRGRFLH